MVMAKPRFFFFSFPPLSPCLPPLVGRSGEGMGIEEKETGGFFSFSSSLFSLQLAASTSSLPARPPSVPSQRQRSDRVIFFLLLPSSPPPPFPCHDPAPQRRRPGGPERSSFSSPPSPPPPPLLFYSSLPWGRRPMRRARPGGLKPPPRGPELGQEHSLLLSLSPFPFSSPLVHALCRPPRALQQTRALPHGPAHVKQNKRAS